MIDLFSEYWRAYLWTDGYRASGLALTMWLLVASMTLGFAMAVPLAMLRVSARLSLALPVAAYTTLFRGTPLYLQLMLVYGGLYSLQLVHDTELLNLFFRPGLNCTVLALALNSCAYTTEILAGALRAGPHGEAEAAQAYGMSPLLAYRRILLPAALRRALPALSNEVVFVLHGTSIAFTATVPELTKIARDVNADTFRPFEAFGIAGLIYLLVTLLLIGAFRLFEHRYTLHPGT